MLHLVSLAGSAPPREVRLQIESLVPLGPLHPRASRGHGSLVRVADAGPARLVVGMPRGPNPQRQTACLGEVDAADATRCADTGDCRLSG